MIPIEQFRQAAALIEDKILKTPLVNSPALSRMFGGEIYLKLENLQKTGSFKIRGATFKLLKCMDDIGPVGVVAASAGNHAQGVALAARQLGIPATIVMPEWVSISKEEATRMYGGQVVISGQSIGECLDEAQRLSRKGRLFIHPFDDADVITGQGTVGLEIFDDMPDTDVVVVPVGGGGLISGIAAVAEAMAPDTQVIGVQTAVCPSAYDAVMKGRITQVDGKSSIADGISVRKVGQLTFDIIQKCVDELVLVEEEQIAAAILMLLER
ncbi:MAG: threonine/serine dehydratase, partial [Desulfobacterales bacterium]